MKYCFCLVLIVLSLVLVSCGDSTVTPDPDITQPIVDVNPYMDPPDYTGDPFEGFPHVIDAAIPEINEEEYYQPEILSGTHFTVQISAATSEETAQRLAESISADTTQPVFVDQSGGYWKVRVGAFGARIDAEEYTNTLREMGFSDAWVTTREP